MAKESLKYPSKNTHPPTENYSKYPSQQPRLITVLIVFKMMTIHHPNKNKLEPPRTTKRSKKTTKNILIRNMNFPMVHIIFIKVKLDFMITS